MRTALLSIRNTTETGDLIGLTGMAGRTILGWQVALARTLGCNRIVCLADQTTPEMLSIQSQTEASGQEFHTVRGSLQLMALVKPEDEIVILQDGLIVPPEYLAERVLDREALRHGVFTIPATSNPAQRYPEQFERVDAQHSWAGLTVMRAEAAAQLSNFHADGEPLSLLLRIALQSGTGIVPIDMTDELAGQWFHAGDTASLAARERSLLEAVDDGSRWGGPTTKLGSIALRSLAPKGLEQGSMASLAAGALFFAIAIALAIYGLAASAIAVGAVAAFLGTLSVSWTRLGDGLLANSGADRNRLSETLWDIPACATLILAAGSWKTEMLVLPILTLGLTRLAGAHLSPSSAPFWNDRALQLAALAICAVYGFLIEGLAVLGLGALIMLLLRMNRRRSSRTE